MGASRFYRVVGLGGEDVMGPGGSCSMRNPPNSSLPGSRNKVLAFPPSFPLSSGPNRVMGKPRVLVLVDGRRRKHSPEHRAKLRLAWQQRRLVPVSVETRAKISAAMKRRIPRTGFTTPPGVRAKISASLKGRRRSLETRRRMSAVRKGRPLSWEHRKNISLAHKGQRPTASNRAAIAAAMKRPEVRAKISAALKGRRQSKEFAARRTQAAIQGLATSAHPNGLERQVLESLRGYFPGAGWNHNSGVVINRKIPDFVRSDGLKVAVDVHGDYVHKVLRNESLAMVRARQLAFRKAGWRLVVIWGSEFKVNPLLLKKRVKAACRALKF